MLCRLGAAGSILTKKLSPTWLWSPLGCWLVVSGWTIWTTGLGLVVGGREGVVSGKGGEKEGGQGVGSDPHHQRLRPCFGSGPGSPSVAPVLLSSFLSAYS